MKAALFSFVLLMLLMPANARSFDEDLDSLGGTNAADVGSDHLWFAFQLEEESFPHYQDNADEYEYLPQEAEFPEMASAPLLSPEDNPQLDFEPTDSADICFVDISPNSDIYIHCN